MGRARLQKQLSAAADQLASQEAYHHPAMVFQKTGAIRLVEMETVLRFLDIILHGATLVVQLEHYFGGYILRKVRHQVFMAKR